MRQYIFLTFLFTFLACGGGQEALTEKDGGEATTTTPQETSPVPPKPTTVREADSLALSMVTEKSFAKDTTQPSVKSESTAKVPEFTFKTDPPDSYDVNMKKDLKFIIIGNKDADITFQWHDPSGEQKRYKQIDKTTRVYIRPYTPHQIKRLIGTGRKSILALIQYDEDQPPVKKERQLVITDQKESELQEAAEAKQDSTLIKAMEPDLDAALQQVPEEWPEPSLPISSLADTVTSETPAPLKKVTPPPISETQTRAVKSTKKVAKMVPPRAIITSDLLQVLSFDDIFFDYAEHQTPSLSFNSNYYVTLGKVVKALKTDDSVKVILTGHTDPDGSEVYNQQLARQRCATVGQLILDLFKPDKRAAMADRIYLQSAGEEALLVESDNSAKQALNRRVSIELAYQPSHAMLLNDFLESEKKASTTGKVKPHPAERPAPRTTTQDTQSELYQKARRLYQAEQYDEALTLFAEILELGPTHPLADNAQWWIGEIHYYRKQYQPALSNYMQVFGLGDGNKAAYAQLRIGYCYYRMGRKEKAIKEFRKVVQQYPDHQEEIEKAQKVIRNISG